MKLVLMPGMDGTGELFKPLLNKLPAEQEYQVIVLNNLVAQNTDEQLQEIAGLIGSDDSLILAESFSGHLAYQLSFYESLNIKHVIFAATFLENPNILTHFRNVLPLTLMDSPLIPDVMLGNFLFSSNANENLIALFKQAIRTVDVDILKRRMEKMAKMKSPVKMMNTTSSYVQASHDYLVPQSSLNTFKLLCPNIDVYRVSGGHCIVQSNPTFFAKLIKDLVKM